MSNLSALPIVALCALLPISASAQDASSRPPPRWLELGGEYRARVEALDGSRFQDGSDDGYVLSRVRFGATVRPADTWRVLVQLQDSHVFLKSQQPARPPFQDVLDIRLAYVEVGRSKNAPLRARIGRQELAFGEERLMGKADWLNTGRTFDGVRVTKERPGVTIDAFAASVVRAVPERPNIPEPGTYVYGVNIALARLLPRVTLEPYVFARRAPNQAVELGGRDALHSATIGGRWTVATRTAFDIGGEMAAQLGGIGGDSIRAWAGHWTVGVTDASVAWKPRVFGEYNYASGDDNAHDGRRQTFDQLYATGHDKLGLADQVGWKNVHHLRTGIDLRPARRLVATARYHSWWLATTTDALYDASGGVLVPAGGPDVSRHVGQEADVQATFTASSRARIAAGYARVFPGALLHQVLSAHPLSYPYVSLSVGF